jgi:RNA polymerase sigma factor (sigma-70 family)
VGSPLDAMLQSYGRLPIPTREEQVLLGRAIRAWLDWRPSLEEQERGITKPPKRLRRAGERARDQLISRNMLLVAKQARSFSVSSMPALEVQDLIQEGAIGLCRAAELFDPTHGFAFSTFAVWWIRQSMTRLVHSSGAIRIPTKRSQAMHKLRRWVEAFTAREGRSPSDAEAMKALALTPGDLAILRDAAAVYQLRSLDAVMGNEDGDSWLSTVAAPDESEPNASDREWERVVQSLRPWPALQEVMERRLAGQPYWEISVAMGFSERVAIRRGREALLMAQWLLQNSAGGREALEAEQEAAGERLEELSAGEIGADPSLERPPEASRPATQLALALELS